MIRIVCVPNIFIVRTNGALSAEAREYHHQLREKETGRERLRASTHQKKNRDDSGWTVYLDVPHGNNWFNKGIIFNYDFFPSLSLSLCLYLFRLLHLPESHINFKGVSQFLYTHFSVPLTFLFLLRLPNCLTAVRYYTRSSLLCYCCYYYICVYTFFFRSLPFRCSHTNILYVDSSPVDIVMCLLGVVCSNGVCWFHLIIYQLVRFRPIWVGCCKCALISLWRARTIFAFDNRWHTHTQAHALIHFCIAHTHT